VQAHPADPGATSLSGQRHCERPDAEGQLEYGDAPVTTRRRPAAQPTAIDPIRGSTKCTLRPRNSPNVSGDDRDAECPPVKNIGEPCARKSHRTVRCPPREEPGQSVRPCGPGASRRPYRDRLGRGGIISWAAREVCKARRMRKSGWARTASSLRRATAVRGRRSSGERRGDMRSLNLARASVRKRPRRPVRRPEQSSEPATRRCRSAQTSGRRTARSATAPIARGSDPRAGRGPSRGSYRTISAAPYPRAARPLWF
jgi:hypothetical protein